MMGSCPQPTSSLTMVSIPLPQSFLKSWKDGQRTEEEPRGLQHVDIPGNVRDKYLNLSSWKGQIWSIFYLILWRRLRRNGAQFFHSDNLLISAHFLTFPLFSISVSPIPHPCFHHPCELPETKSSSLWER
jgi:hypothetical protein